MNDNQLTNLSNSREALDWIGEYSKSIDSYSALCVALLAWLFMTSVDLNITKYVTAHVPSNYCLNELITLHCIIFLFSTLHGLDVQQRLKKVANFKFSDLKNYLFESVEVRDLTSDQTVTRRKRLIVLTFTACILAIAVPIQFFFWREYVTQCISHKPIYQVNGLLGILFYAFLLVRLPFYILVLLKSRT